MGGVWVVMSRPLGLRQRVWAWWWMVVAPWGVVVDLGVLGWCPALGEAAGLVAGGDEPVGWVRGEPHSRSRSRARCPVHRHSRGRPQPMPRRRRSRRAPRGRRAPRLADQEDAMEYLLFIAVPLAMRSSLLHGQRRHGNSGRRRGDPQGHRDLGQQGIPGAAPNTPGEGLGGGFGS